MADLPNISENVAAQQDNQLQTMSTQLEMLRNENAALKLENQRRKTQLDENTARLVSKTEELDRIELDMGLLDGLHNACTICCTI